MPNEYSDLINQAVAAPPEPQPTQPIEDNPYREAVGQIAERDRVIVRTGLVQDKARAARILRLQSALEVPADLIDSDLDGIEREAQAQGFDINAWKRDSPRLASWVAQQPEHLAISKDDLPRIAAAERLVRESPDYAYDGNGGVLGPAAPQGEAGGVNRPYFRSTLDLYRGLREQNDLAGLDAMIQRGRDEAVRERFGNVGGRFIAGVAGSLSATQRVLGTADTSTAADRLSESAARNMPGVTGDIISGLGGVAADIPLMLAGGALAPLARIKALATAGKAGTYAQAALTTAVVSQPLALREGIAAGRDSGWANGLASWGIETLVPAAFGTTGTEKVLAGLAKRGVAEPVARGYARAAGRLLVDAGLEATEEAVTEYAHAIHEVASGIDARALDGDRLWPRLITAGAVGGLVGGAFNAPAAALEARGIRLDAEVGRMIAASDGAAVVGGILDAAAASPGTTAAPDQARTLFQSIADERAPTLYFDREAWDTHIKSLNQDPRARAAEILGDGGRTYDEAARTGEPLAFPTGTLAVALADAGSAGTRAWAQQEAKVRPDAWNAREQQARLAELESLPDDPEAKVAVTAAEAAQAVQDDVEQQLVAAGYDAVAARHSAAQLSSVFRTMAARWNAGKAPDDATRTDARKLFNEWNIGINRPVAEVLASPTGASSAEAAAAMRLGAIRAKLADAELAKIDASRAAAQQTADESLAKDAAGEPGFALIQEATAKLEDAGGTMTAGDAMRTLGPDFGFKPDATAAKLTIEQARRGVLLSAALRARGRTLSDLLIDAGVARPEPQATSVAPSEAKPDDPRLEKLAADALRLVDIASALRGAKMSDDQSVALYAQASTLAAEVGPEVDALPLDDARKDDVRQAVGFAQDDAGGGTLNQGDGGQAGGMKLDLKNKQTLAELAEMAREHFLKTERTLAVRWIQDDPSELELSGRIPLDPSHRWDDNEPTSDVLPGTSAIAADKLHKIHGTYIGDPYLIDGIDTYEVGTDAGEVVLKDARIIRPLFANRPAERSGGERLARVTMEQRKKGPRGSITFGRNADGSRRTDIRLFQQADLSTVLHESGHLYLELLIDLAGRDGAPQDIKDDLATLLRWLGVKDPSQIRTEHHEKMAQGFEQYLREGKAPNIEMRGAFARFAAWMAQVYRDVRGMLVDINPDVRGVFDRLLATQQEIDAAETALGADPIFPDAKAAGMTDEQFAAYQATREASRLEARERLMSEAMAIETRERTAAWREARAEVAAEVELEVNRAKEYVAESILRRGTLPGGVPLPPSMPAIKLDSAELNVRLANRIEDKRARADAKSRLAKMHTRTGGMSLDAAAQLLGFDSGDDLLTAMIGLRDRTELIKAETDARMRQRFGDLMTDGSIAEKAMDVVHNEKRADLHLMEVSALGRRVGKRPAPAEIFREAARRRIATRSIRALDPRIHAIAEAKARRAVEAALAKGDFDAAWIAKQQELLAAAMYRASRDAKADVEKAVDKLKTFTERKARERLGKAGGWEWSVTRPDGSVDTYDTEAEARAAAAKIGPNTPWGRTGGFVEKIDELLERYELADIGNRGVDRRDALRLWVAEQQAKGLPVQIPPEILARAKAINWREATVQEILGLRDTVVHLASIAGRKRRLSEQQKKADLDATAANLAKTLARTKPTIRATPSGDKPGWWRRLLTDHRKAASLAREMDGDEAGGPWSSVLIDPLRQAATAEAQMVRQADERLNGLWKAWGKQIATESTTWPAGERRHFDGFHGGLTRMQAIMVALNWGNEGNRDRLLNGGYIIGGPPLTDAQVQRVLDSLTASDWNLVEGVWDAIDAYWPEIAALEQRTTGIAPGKVEPSSFVTRHGTIKGGYFPIVYSKNSTRRIDADREDAAAIMQGQARGNAQTAHGHAHERTGGDGSPLELDPSVIGRHVQRVAHDLTHREALNDAMRVLMHKDVRGAIDIRMGSETASYLRQWIMDIASGPPTTSGDRFLAFLRRGFSMSTMGFRTMTAMVQVTGFANAVPRVGARNMGKAMAELFATNNEGQRTWAWIAEQSPMMAERGRSQTREQAETLGSLTARGGGALAKLEAAQQKIAPAAYWMMGKVQSVVDRATWLAAYHQATDAGSAHAEAVQQADQAVLDTQGSGLTSELSAVQRSRALQVFTGAYTYGATLYQLNLEQIRKARRGDYGGALVGMLLVNALPAALTLAMRGLARDWWDDDTNEDPFAQRVGVETASSLMGSVVGARELSGLLTGYAYSGPAVLKPVGDILKLAQQIKQGEADPALLRAVVDAAGSTAGLPSGQAWATGSGLLEWLENPSMDIRAPIFGPAPRNR